MRVYKSLYSFRGNSAFLTWMYRVVTNVCKDDLRKRAREKTVSIRIKSKIKGRHRCAAAAYRT
ncbi:sigma factor [Thermincola ferriacetica]